MHRLISARSIYPNGFHNITLPSNATVKYYGATERNCSFCQKNLLGQNNIGNIVVRHQSTRTARLLQKTSKKRAKYKEYKKYGELLQVGDNAMTEMKVSISKLRATQLSKLASSSLSLGQLHQLTSKKTQQNQMAVSEVDPELLQSVKEKILKKGPINKKNKEIHLEDDKCALIFTNNTISGIEDKLKTKLTIDMIKESYYKFRKATLYDQKLNDLRFAINEGVFQELTPSTAGKLEEDHGIDLQHKGPHAVFREFFFDNPIENYDHEFMTQISRLQSQGVPYPAIEDMYDEQLQHNEIMEGRDEAELETDESVSINNAKSLKISKLKQDRSKRKALKKKLKAIKESNMRNDLKVLERQGKQEALHKLLLVHFQLLCSLDMLNEGQQILQHYQHLGNKSPNCVKVTDVGVYNVLLHGFASKGDYNKIQEILSQLNEDGIEVNAQTYAAVFECIERSALDNKIDLLRQYCEAMTNKGITLNDIMDKSKFIKDQRTVVLKAINRLDRNFVPEYSPPVLDYVCPLLDSLKLDKDPIFREGLKQSPTKGLLSVEELKQRVRKQFDIEMKGEIEVMNIDIKDDTSKSIQFYRKNLQATENEWRDVIKEAFVRNLRTLKSQSYASHDAITMYPYLKVLDVDQYVHIIMGEIRKLVDGSETYSPTLKLLQRDLGLQVYQKYQIEQYREKGVLAKLEQLYDKYCEWYHERMSVDGTGLAYNARQVWQTLIHQNRDGASMDIKETPWSMEMRQNIGKFLYNIILNDVKIDVNMFKTKNTKPKKLPAVYKVHRPWARVVRLEVKPHPVLARLWHGAAWPGLRMRAQLAPLVCPAAPWIHPHYGAYLLTGTPLLRLPFFVVQQMKRLEAAPSAALHPLLDSLNQLGEVPWVINKPILDLQLQVFRSGGCRQLDIPQPPSALDTSQFEGDRADKAGMFRRRIAINRARSEMYSLWCDALYKLSLANHYRDDMFWLPHNMDFRGRVYACPPHLSQLGADSARSLLLFARRRPLGAGGLRWLKLHAINLTGTMKKFTLDERLAYADSIIDKILDSADRPLDGERWWTHSEEPWQTLACCREIANAIRSGNPEAYECGFPVHQDGSCNGLQHYAALGGDEGGARAVNLTPLERPQDVYAAIAALVEERRARDAENGVQCARALESFVRRKVIKQTVMTTVYGVTRFGARLQIAKQLKDIEEFPKKQVWACSSYLTAKTFDSLGEMFTSTRLIQDWFTECAKVISVVCGESVEWVTPLGLPVVQPYFRRAAPSSSRPDSHQAPVDHQQRPCTMKQRNAFPPNFIHSLDSTHMMLTALACQARGVAFVSVHDCFWTHPDTVDHMNKIVREQFVALHSRPLLQELSEFLVQRYSYTAKEIEESGNSAVPKKRLNHLLMQVPAKGKFDLKSVLDSVYFFS